MSQKVVQELLRRSGFVGWAWYLWAVTITLMLGGLTYLTFRPGILALFA